MAQADGASPKNEILFVANFLSHDIMVLDVETAETIHRIDLGMIGEGADQMGIQADYFKTSPNQDTLYFSAFPRKDEVDIRSEGALYAMDTRTFEIKWKLPIHGQVNHICISSDGSTVYVPIRDRNYVEVVDTATQRIVGRAISGWGPHSTQLSADGKHLYVGCMWEDVLTIIDTETLATLKKIPFGEAVRPFYVTNDQRIAYVQLSKLHGFRVYDLDNDYVAQTVHFPPNEDGSEPYARAWNYTITHGVKVTHDESKMYVAATAANFIAAYDLPSLRITGTVPVGKEPAYVTLNGDERICFASNRKEETVSFIDTSTLEEFRRVPIGGRQVSRLIAVTPPAA